MLEKVLEQYATWSVFQFGDAPTTEGTPFPYVALDVKGTLNPQPFSGLPSESWLPAFQHPRSHRINCVGGGKAERTNNRILRHSQRSCATISSISATEPYRSVKVLKSQ